MEENRLTAEYVGEVISEAQTKDKKECIDKIVRLAREIVNTYREYNPEGNYLDICFLGVGNTEVPMLKINNNYWENPFSILYTEEINDVN